MKKNVAAVLLLAACSGGGSKGHEPHPKAVQSFAEATAPQADPVPSEAARYEVSVEPPTQSMAGTESIAKVWVTPMSPWHMNLDFPASLSIRSSPEVELVVDRQRKEDAERLDDDGLVFAVPFTSNTAGDQHFEGEVRFAVCGDATCAPVTVPVEFTVPVACDPVRAC